MVKVGNRDVTMVKVNTIFIYIKKKGKKKYQRRQKKKKIKTSWMTSQRLEVTFELAMALLAVL